MCDRVSHTLLSKRTRCFSDHKQATNCLNRNRVLVSTHEAIYKTKCVIVGYRSGLTELFRVLGYYAAYGGYKQTFRDYLLITSPRVKLCCLLGQLDS